MGGGAGRRRFRSTFAALEVRNYRLYFLGQVFSRVGTWLQVVGLTWLAFELTGSATWIGIVLGAQTVPLLFLSPYGGLLADRADKHRLLLRLQALRLALAVGLTLLVVSGGAVEWSLVLFAVLTGAGQALDTPARQAFVQELVGPERLRNAVGLNSVLANTARMLGPALAGLVISVWGVAACFALDALSYVVFLLLLSRMDRSRLLPSPPAARARRQLRAGLVHVRSDPHLWGPLVLMLLVGMFTFEFPVTLPALAARDLEGGAGTYGLLMSALGAGAVAGALVAAARQRGTLLGVFVSAALFGCTVALAALAPVLPLLLPALFLVGAAGVTFSTSAATTLQLSADPLLRGRVMALWVVAFQGSTALGAPIVGYVTEVSGARFGLGLGAAVAVASGLVGAAFLRRRP